jgi:hemerythrin-like domain-containing protein
MKATKELKEEHQGVLLMLRVIGVVADKFGREEQVSAADLDGMMEFLSVFVDKCHHGKEEEHLFPAMEAAGVLREGGPIGVMLSEHDAGRALAAKLKGAVGGYKSGNRAAPGDFRQAAGEYLPLLRAHIDKENNVLFPMADAKLGPEKDAELVAAFEKLELERIGPGKHEEFHGLLHRLKSEYLG